MEYLHQYAATESRPVEMVGRTTYEIITDSPVAPNFRYFKRVRTDALDDTENGRYFATHAKSRNVKRRAA